MKSDKEKASTEWRIKKLKQIMEQEGCNSYEAQILFLLQDISYKLYEIMQNTKKGEQPE